MDSRGQSGGGAKRYLNGWWGFGGEGMANCEADVKIKWERTIGV